MNKVVAAFGIVLLIFGVVLVALASVPIPETITEAYLVPESTVVEDHFGHALRLIPIPTTQWTDGFSFNEGDLLNIDVNVTSGGRVDFYVTDGSKGVSSNLDSTIYLSYPNVTAVSTDWVIPKNASYDLIFKTLGATSEDAVHWQIVKNWNETSSRNVTLNVPLLPFSVLYFGVGSVLSGLVIAAYGTILNKRMVHS